MQGLAGFLVLMGAGSFVLNMLNREFVLLGWIDNWGAATGTLIRVGMIVAGIGLFVVGAMMEPDEEDEELARDATRHL
ncbi:hypothetical protein Pla123a_47120 [Posidoniimonas polymericola]|uniref:DUF378 domain-containing protein n=1 Tax=Posidoniimonas polymericola TaxID=2528002 RepID=A0A5C5XUB6_9BACT|nr:hypothetical protein [Posidoniimonas polymericola]TWT66318.1 hypothetical protein Pla123a_47120 [Posidoniimonas polymericola]